MKIKFIIASFLLLLSGIVNAKISDTEAKKLVEDYVANKEGLENAVVYQAPDLLTKISISLGDSIVMEHPSWCFFINPTPNSNWQHKCKYARVSSVDGNMVVITKTMPPVDWEKWTNISAQQSDLRSYTTNSQVNYGLYSKNKTSKVNDHAYAVIISGGQSPNGRCIAFWNNASMTYQALRDICGVKKENIHVLMSGGVNATNDIVIDEKKKKYMTSPKDLDGDKVWDVNDACTYTTIKNTLSNLAGKLTTSDELYILLDTHGALNSVALWDPIDDEGMTASQFKEAIAPIKAKSITIVITACQGGSFIDDLKGPNRTVISSSRSDESSWMGAVSLFYDPFLAAGTGFFADDRLSFKDSNSDGKKQSTEYLYADADKNGSVSNIEAFAYALTENGQDHSINADSSWHEYPQYWSSSVNVKAPITNGSGDIMSDGTIYASNKLNKAIIEYRSSKNIILQKGFSTKNTKFKGIKSSVLRSLNIPADIEDDEVFEYEGITDIDDAISEINGVEIYPNPTNGLLYIHANSPINKIIVSDATGKIVMDINGGSDEIDLNLSSNAKGLYLVNVITESESYIEKVVLK